MRVETAELIDTIVDGGRTHFAIDGDYAGSIDTYNNPITKFGAWLAGKSITVTVNGEKLYANCNSLRKFLLKNNVDFRSLEEFSYRDLSSYQFRLLPFYGKERFMGAHISNATRDILAKDLFKAIGTGDQGLALKKIRQGAELDTHAWFNEESGEFFFKKDFAPSLPARHLNPQRFTEATPFLLASRLNQVAVATLIREQEGDLSLVGQTLIFTREKMDTKSHWNLVPTTRYEVVEEEDEDGYRRKTVVSRLGVDVQTSETHYFTDIYDDRNLMTFNPYTQALEYTPQNSIHTQWDTHHLTAILPVW